MIDIVDLAAAVLELDQYFEDRQNIGLAQGAHAVVGIEPQPRVHLDPTDRGQIIAFGIKKQAVEQSFRGLQGRRLARAHDSIDVDQRVLARRILVDRQGVSNVRANRHVIDVQHRQFTDSRFDQLGECDGGDLVTGFEINLAGLLVDQI